MTKLSAHEDNPDGLEITSIGTLYTGPWDKKYWSSSRGKDRYPYPVGYQASRAYNGNKYTIEIHEGPKGPSFLITSPDGNSSSGQTPNITWEKFQKKYCPRTKIWHGKRFSCNIDGVEFFGFKHPFFQRLLREMAANFSRSAEENLSSGHCKEIPKEDDVSCNLEALSKSPELLPSVEKSKLTGKRTKRLEVKNTVVSSSNSRKKSRSQLKNASESSDPINDGQSIRGAVESLHSTKEDHDSCVKTAVLPQPLNSVPDIHKKGLISENESPLNSIDNPEQLKNNVSAEVKRLLNNSDASTGAGSLAINEIHVDRLQGTDVKDNAFPAEVAVKEKESTCLLDTQVLNDVGFAPDTLDIDQDCTSDNKPSTQATINKLRDKVNEGDPMTSKNPAIESHPEAEIGAFNSNADSGKSDFDSVGHETAEFMMSFLLPQAIPLLSRTPRKKKAKVSVLETLLSEMNSKQENRENDLACKEASSSSEGKFNKNTSEAESRVCDKCGKSTVIGKLNGSLDCCLEAINNENVLCSNKVHMDSSVMLQHSDAPEESTEATMNCKDVIFSPHEKGLTVPDSIDSAVATDSVDEITEKVMLSSSNVQLKEDGMQIEPVKTGNTPDSQSPVCVYSRRKKIRTKSQKKEIYNGPLSESIICRSSGDGNVTDTCPTVSHSDTFETQDMRPLNEISHEKGLSGVGLEVSRKSKSSIADTPTMDPSTMQNNLDSAVKQDLSSKCAPKDIEAIVCFEQLDLEMQKFAIDIDMKVIPDKSIAVTINNESFQDDSKIFKSSSVAREFQNGGSDFKPKSSSIKKDFLGILKQVGYYNLPLPVLSVMVCTGITEIHICIVCDLSIGKDKTLFMYKVATQDPTFGIPSFLGHTVIALPTLKDYFGREISVERSGLQFTPGGHSLISLDSIRMPYCRQGKISCLCSTCASRSFDGDTVKIVTVNSGFVTVVAKLKTNEILQCALVCEPNHLVAVGESGRLHLWVMNSAWIVQTGKYNMPSNDIMSPGIVELKRIPKCNSLVIGHNGFGEFSLWDISKRAIVSKFSSSSSSVCDFLPIGIFRWKRDSQVSSGYDVDGHVNRMIASTNAWFSNQTSDCSVSPFEEDFAIWLLVSADSESDAQHNYMSQDYQSNSAGLWRLAVLAKKTVLMGTTLDPSASAIGASSGHGIVGTSDGLVYVWEMTTGAQLGTLHQFNGKAVSCIATDGSSKGAVAIASGDRVLVYLPL